MKVCKSRDCKNDFKPESNRQTFCSSKCKNREAYLTYKDTGANRYKDQSITYTLTCKSRDCNKEFDTTSRMKKYCSVPCSKREIQKNHTENGSKSVYVKKTKKKLACGYRNCKNEFESSHAKAKYCCTKHAKQEAYIVDADKNRPNRVITPRYPTEREVRFKIPHFSAKWLEDKWNNAKILSCN